MNIFNKVALQGLKKNRTRALVTIIGVILSAAMITAVATFGTSLLNFLINGSIAKTGNWHVAFMDADQAFIKERKADEEVAHVCSFENIGYAPIEGIKSEEKPYLFVAGFEEDTYENLPIHMIAGRKPENSSEILIPNHISIKGDVKYSIGDTLTLKLGKRELGSEQLSQHDAYQSWEKLVPSKIKTYTVVGIYERSGFEEHQAPGYTAITKADSTESAASHSVYVTLKSPRDVRDYMKKMTEAGSVVMNEDVLRFMGVSDNKLFNTVLYSIGGLLVAIIMIGSVFLIYNAFNISLNERMHQLGILMSVGATGKQIRNSVLFEGTCIGIIGIPLGILIGIGSIVLLLPAVSDNFGSIVGGTETSLTLSVSVLPLLVAAILSQITIWISAYIPAKKAANKPVMECIRQTGEIKTEAKELKTSRLADKLYGLEGILARKNFKRNKRRYRSVVLSLVLSMVLFVSGNAFGSALKSMSRELTGQQSDADVQFSSGDMDEQSFRNLYEQMKTADGITQSSYQENGRCVAKTNDLPEDFVKSYRVSTKDTGTESEISVKLNIQFIEDDIFEKFLKSKNLNPEEYKGENAKYLMVAFSDEHEIFFEHESADFTLMSSSGEPAKTIQCVFENNYAQDLVMVGEDRVKYTFILEAPLSQRAQFEGVDLTDVEYGGLFLSESSSRSVEAMTSMILEKGVTADYTLFNLSAAFDLFRSIDFVITVFTVVFVGMITLIAVANVFNTISTNIQLRRRELAMLRSVGMSDRAFGRMMNFECLFYGFQTLLFGIPIASVLSWGIYAVIGRMEQMEHFTFAFPWASMLFSVLGVFLIVSVTMLYATSKIRRENIIDALRDDMT